MPYELYCITVENPESNFHNCVYYGQHKIGTTQSNYFCSSALLKNYIQKYGIGKLKREVYFHCDTKEETDLCEKYLINQGKFRFGIFPKGKCLNISDGGRGGGINRGKKLSKSHKKKISDSNKGKRRSIEVRQNISKGKKGKTIKGHPCSEEHKKKISAYFTGRKQKKEQVEQRAKKIKGTKWTEEQRQNFSKIKKGIKKSKEHCQNMGKVRQGRQWFTNGIICKYCFDCPSGFIKGRIINKKGMTYETIKT